MTAQCHLLPGGRLHCNHGPIDLIIEADGEPVEISKAYAAASKRFATILEELVAELPLLRVEHRLSKGPHPSRAPARSTFPKGEGKNSFFPSPLERGDRCAATVGEVPTFQSPIACAMHAATLPYAAERINPMAAVAGAVADEILRTLINSATLRRTYVNNGGDIALHLASGQAFAIAAPSGQINITSKDNIDGIATSGWRGRSFSLGIADAVTVLAATAAEADAAATMIANRVDLPDSPKVTRVPANSIAPDSDLHDRPVTTAVEPLTEAETIAALAPAKFYAETLLAKNLMTAATLMLNGKIITLSHQPRITRHA
jgi:uncharacterized protein